MMDNELPWNPLGPQQIAQIPKISSQVPDVTLFSPNNNQTNQKSNFLQRAIANERVFNNPIQQPPRNLKNPVLSNAMFATGMQITPSVPDLSLFNPQPFNPVNRMTGPTRPNSSSTSNIFAKADNSTKENVFDAIGKHSVPDVTILDEEPKQANQQRPSTDRVFSESYKKMLINSHEKFMKQMKTDVPSTEQVNPAKKKSGLFNPQANKYQENPLRKYAPKPQPIANEKDGNSSSILMEFDEVAEPPKPVSTESDEKIDGMTFKKVAEMLSEIQRRVIPGQTAMNKVDQEVRSKKSLKTHEVLRSLASSYLSKEELEFYKVQRELDEMEDEAETDEES